MHFTWDNGENFLCHCGGNIWLAEKTCSIRPKVCRDLPKYGEIDGKSYCVLHFPSAGKVADFIPVFAQRWEDENFDFRGVWFPCEINYGEIFAKDVDFSHAIFAGNVEFMCATFAGKATFDDAEFRGFAAFETSIFKAEATFLGAKFSKDPSFFDVTFEKDVSFQDAEFYESPNFHGAKFLSRAYFSLSKFLKGCFFGGAEFFDYAGFANIKFHENCSFDETVFFDEADFGYSVFEGNSDVIFQYTEFKGKADFRFAVVKGYFHLEGGDYKHYEGVSEGEELVGEAKFTNLFENEADFIFMRTEDAKAITFYKTRLSPSWFVNVDLQKFKFIDCIWENCEANEKNIENEIQRLTEREISSPNHLLTIAYRNLADNAEKHNQFEDSEKFRKMATLSNNYKQYLYEPF